MSKTITEKFLKTVPKSVSGSTYIWDTAENGFGLRVTATGKKSFVLAYRIGGKQRRFTIGPWPDFSVEAAKQEAAKLRVGIRGGVDPLEVKHKDRLEPTVGDLLTVYMESDKERAKRPSSKLNDRSMAEKIVRPNLGRLRLDTLHQRDIKSLHRALEATPYRANRVVAFLSAVFAYGIQEEWLTINPARGVKKYEEAKRECFLTVDQMEKLHKALDQYPDQSPANALRLLMVTGSREMEVLRATWDQFDLERGVWRKPASTTKQKKVHHLVLGSEAVDLLVSMAPANMAGHLFPGKDGPRTTLRRVWAEVLKNAGLTSAEMKMVKGKMTKKHRPLVRIHDLRHNFASYLASANVSLPAIGQLLGHTQAATTMRYAHLQNESQRATTNIFGMVYRTAKKMA